MAYFFADGSRFFLGAQLGEPVSITDASNASPVVLTAQNSFQDGDEILISSGWDDITDSVYRPSALTGSTIELGGSNPIDTTDSQFYPPGSGTGTARKVQSWIEIGQVLGINSTGGDPRYVNIEPLARRTAIKVPVGFNPQDITLDIGYDPELPGYQALVQAARTLQRRAFKLALGGGQTGYGYGYVSVNESPKLQKGQVNQVSATFALLGKFIGYQ